MRQNGLNSPIKNSMVNTIDNNRPRVAILMRVSLDRQSWERQQSDLELFCAKRNYDIVATITEKVSGRKKINQREDLKELFELVRSGKISKVVTTEVSRIARLSRNVRQTIDFLHDHKVSVVFQSLGGLESLDETGNETLTANIIIAVWSEVAQEEVRTLRERVVSGLRQAKLDGKTLGRPKGKTNDKALLQKYPTLVKDLKKGLSLRQCEKIHDVSRCTVIKIRKILN